MAVQFILGRSGTGKTTYCLDAIAAALRTDSDNADARNNLEKLMAAMPPEEALPETGGPGLAGMLSLWLGAGGLLIATLGLGLRRLWTASR